LNSEKEKTQKQEMQEDSENKDIYSKKETEKSSGNSSNSLSDKQGNGSNKNEQINEGEQKGEEPEEKPQSETTGQPQKEPHTFSIKNKVNVGHSVEGQVISDTGTGNNFQTGDVYNFYSGDLKEFKDNRTEQITQLKEEKSLSELTTNLPSKEFFQTNFEIDQIDYFSKTLSKEHIIFISSLDDQISSAAAYALIERLKISKIENNRLLDFERNVAEELELDGYSLLNCKNNFNEKTSILIDATDKKAQKFLDSIVAYSHMSSQSIKDQLKNKQQFWICLLNPKTFDLRVNLNNDTRFSFWDIDFLIPLLKKFFSNKYEELSAQIKSQKERNLWGSNEQEFYELITGYIRNNQFENEVEKRKNKDANDDNLKQAKVEELLNKDVNEENTLELTVLYVATFFHELNPKDFYEVVELLIGDKTIIINKSKSVFEEGKIKHIEIEEEKKLRDIWEEKSDSILKKCRLRAINLKGVTRILKFSDPELKIGLKYYFETSLSIYIEKQFHIIQSYGLLFTASEKITESVIHLAVQMVISNPNRHGKEWLTSLVLGVTRYFKINIDDGDSPDDVLKKLFNKEIERIKLQFVLERISELIREMLKHSELKGTVDEFLNQLIARNYYFPVFEIIKKLRFVLQLKIYYWLKQLIDRGTEDIRQEVYLFMLSVSKENEKVNIYELLSVLKKWLPEAEREPETYSLSNKYALLFLLDYSFVTVGSYAPQEYGAWPSEYPLFIAPAGESSFEEKFSSVADWLYHRGMQSVIKEYVDVDALIASLIVEWAVILLGLGKDTVPPEASKCLNAILRQIANSSASTPTRQKKLIDTWIEMKKSLLIKINALKLITERQKRKKIIQRRNLVRSIIIDFQIFSK